MQINDVIELCTQRSSCRSYDPTRAVSRETIDQCIEAARLAPSACNRQPWRFVVVESEGARHQILEKCRMPGIPHQWWDDVPVFIALCADREFFTHKLAAGISGLPYWALDVGIAGEHLVLRAAEAGLGTCWIGWICPRRVRRIVAWPRRVRPVALITLGWPREDVGVCERSRKAIDEIVDWR